MNFAQMLGATTVVVKKAKKANKPVVAAPVETKVCRYCLLPKPLEDFYPYVHRSNGKTYRRCYCKTCFVIYNREHRKQKRDRQDRC